MTRSFNVTGSCDPNLHYMVNIQSQLDEIRKLVDSGAYFSINRARQYGKTTTISALKSCLNDKYCVVNLDFQFLSHASFENEGAFVRAFSREMLSSVEEGDIPDGIRMQMQEILARKNDECDFSLLFFILSKWCKDTEKPVVLIIDEVDSATNNQVFLDFLAQLRGYYIHRNTRPTFQSVIFAGVYDVKNIRRKIRQDEDHKLNSPWNIAADFNVNMSLSEDGIAGMLAEYEADWHTGMNAGEIAKLIYEYTSGYPFLVSRICKLIDERIAGSEEFTDKKAAWTRAGFLEAVKLLISESNTLFESLTNKLIDYPELKIMLSAILFEGKDIPYVATNPSIEIATMFGFVRNEHNTIAVTNRIFETVLYNHLLAEEVLGSRVYDSAQADKNQFVAGGRLNMKRVMERFVEVFDDLYGDENERFLEEIGRKYFMLFLKPIINGVGHCYIEARTRNRKRTDIVVEYRGEQFVIELKIWSGPKYHADGEQQITEYLEFYHLKKGYMLTFNFNKKKEIGVREITVGDRILVEAVV